MTPTPPSVRILPMSSSVEFPDQNYEHVQLSFFLSELAEREDGYYLFPKNGLIAEPGTVVLFQFDAKIIASATFLRMKKFDQIDGGAVPGLELLHFLTGTQGVMASGS